MCRLIRSRQIEDSEAITVLQVIDVDKRQGIVTYKAASALKGKAPADPVVHWFGAGLSADERQAFFEWAKSGNRAICFQKDPSNSHICVGNAWYHVAENGKVSGCLDSSTQIYVGCVARLREHIVAIRAGKEVAITAAPPSRETPIPRDWLRGDKARIW